MANFLSVSSNLQNQLSVFEVIRHGIGYHAMRMPERSSRGLLLIWIKRVRQRSIRNLRTRRAGTRERRDSSFLYHTDTFVAAGLQIARFLGESSWSLENCRAAAHL